MIIVVGLGNPGRQYEKTRHNIGFLLLDQWSRQFHFDLNKKKFNAQCGEATLFGKKALFVKPQSFMNLSGDVVSEFFRFYKLNPKQIVIVHDDIDLVFGDVRAKAKGGTAGHNGLESIVAAIGSHEFHRIRIGVGRPADPAADVAQYVLSPFTEDEQKQLPKLYSQATDTLEKTLAGLK